MYKELPTQRVCDCRHISQSLFSSVFWASRLSKWFSELSIRESLFWYEPAFWMKWLNEWFTESLIKTVTCCHLLAYQRNLQQESLKNLHHLHTACLEHANTDQWSDTNCEKSHSCSVFISTQQNSIYCCIVDCKGPFTQNVFLHLKISIQTCFLKM